MAEISWSWIEKFFKNIPSLDYRLVSVSFATITLAIYLYASTIINSFRLDPYYSTVIISTFILIAILPSGIMYFIYNIKQSVEMLNHGTIDYNISRSIIQDLNNRFTESRYYLVLVVLVVLPCMLIDAYSIWIGKTSTFWHWEGTTISLIFTIFYYLMGFFISLMLATVIWILINIRYFLIRLSSKEILSELNINVFNGFQVGFLSNLKNLLIKFMIYYFICVAFAILLYVSPAQLVSYQMLLYISIDLLGMVIFLSGWISIQNIFRRKWQEKTMEIDNLYNDRYHELTTYISKNMKDEKELARLSSILDVLQKQRDKLTQIIKGNGDFTNIAKVSFTFLGTILALARNIFDILGSKVT